MILFTKHFFEWNSDSQKPNLYTNNLTNDLKCNYIKSVDVYLHLYQ